MVNKAMRIVDVLQMDRYTAPIFMSFGMHSLVCPPATAESIEDACQAHGIDADELVEKLNEYFAQKV